MNHFYCCTQRNLQVASGKLEAREGQLAVCMLGAYSPRSEQAALYCGENPPEPEQHALMKYFMKEMSRFVVE